MKRSCGHLLVPSHFCPGLTTVCHEFCKIKFWWVMPEMNLHSCEAVVLNSWSSWNEQLEITRILRSLSAFFKVMHMWLGCWHSQTAWWNSIPINCRTGGVLVHSEGWWCWSVGTRWASIWLHTGVLEHAVLHTALSTQTSDVCDMLTAVLWKTVWKAVSVHLLYTPGGRYNSLLAS